MEKIIYDYKNRETNEIVKNVCIIDKSDADELGLSIIAQDVYEKVIVNADSVPDEIETYLSEEDSYCGSQCSDVVVLAGISGFEDDSDFWDGSTKEVFVGEDWLLDDICEREICKKSYDNIRQWAWEELSEHGCHNSFEVKKQAIVKLNDLLREEGLIDQNDFDNKVFGNTAVFAALDALVTECREACELRWQRRKEREEYKNDEQYENCEEFDNDEEY